MTVPPGRYPSLELPPVPFSGVPPLKVRWSFSGGAARPLVRFEFDETGGRTFGRPMATFRDVEVTYTTPGLPFPMLRATDNQGNQCAVTTPLNILPRDQKDALLRARWEGMRAALMRGDIEGAVSFFIPVSQEGYRRAFTALSSTIGQIGRDMRDIRLISLMSLLGSGWRRGLADQAILGPRARARAVGLKGAGGARCAPGSW